MQQKRGSGIVIEAQTDVLEASAHNGMVSVDDLLGRNPFAVRADRDGNPMFVGTAYEQNVGAFQPLEPDIDIRRDIGSGKMPDVQGAVCIGESSSHKKFLS